MTNTSRTSFLARPQTDDKISERTLGYVTESAREDMFDMLATACVEAGVTRSQIAKRLGKDPAQVTRQLSSPGNWTIDTIAEYLFAINGTMLRASSYNPEEEPLSNDRHPRCFTENVVSIVQVTKRMRRLGAERHVKTATTLWK